MGVSGKGEWSKVVVIKALAESDAEPVEVGPGGRVGVEAAGDEELEEGEDVLVAVVEEFLRVVEPVVGVVGVPVDLAARGVVGEKEGVVAVEEFVGDDAEGEDVVLLVEVSGGEVAFGGGVGHGEAGRVVWVGAEVPAAQTSGW